MFVLPTGRTKIRQGGRLSPNTFLRRKPSKRYKANIKDGGHFRAVVPTWGATYPVAYAYDAYGRMTAMNTFRDEAMQNGDTTTWLYHEPTGLLTNKVYADGKGPSYTYTSDGKLATRTWARWRPWPVGGTSRFRGRRAPGHRPR